MSELQRLQAKMRQFTAERDWERFHDPKSLILAMVGETGELAELFQWLPAHEAADLSRHEPLRSKVADELADILLYAVRLADVLGLDLDAEASRKLSEAELRFPPTEFHGVAPQK